MLNGARFIKNHTPVPTSCKWSQTFSTLYNMKLSVSIWINCLYLLITISNALNRGKAFFFLISLFLLYKNSHFIYKAKEFLFISISRGMPKHFSFVRTVRDSFRAHYYNYKLLEFDCLCFSITNERVRDRLSKNKTSNQENRYVRFVDWFFVLETFSWKTYFRFSISEGSGFHIRLVFKGFTSNSIRQIRKILKYSVL